MIRSVEFSGSFENPITVDLVKPDQEGLTITNIDGLGAGKADLFTSGRASMDGDVFNGARLGARNIVITFEYGEKLDPEDGRDLSYDVFPLKENITMIFTTSTKKVTITGYVESNEPEIFTNEPRFVVSILCTDPYFKSIDEDQETIKLYSLVDKFEFPFSNESLTENLLEMGEYSTDMFAEIAYNGNQATGALIRFIFTGPATHPTITNDRTGQTMRIDTTVLKNITGEAVKAGDILELNTVRGQKSVTLVRKGIRKNVINALAPASQWIELKRGVNPISVTADTGGYSIQTEVVFDSYYSGI